MGKIVSGLLVTILALSLLSIEGYAQTQSGTTVGGRYIPYGEGRVINSPTAWTKEKGSWELGMRLFPFTFRGELGLTNYLTLGVSYGGANVFGFGSPDWNPRPAFLAKVLITQGNSIVPAIAFGYEDQGYGPWLDTVNPFKLKKDGVSEEFNRYQVKSKGFFLVASQEYKLLGVTAIHVGINYAITERRDEGGITAYAALEKSINPDFWFLADYDLGLNDNSDYALGGKKGFLDLGIRWRVAPEFNVEVFAMNLLQNQKDKMEALGRPDAGKWSRALSLTFKAYF